MENEGKGQDQKTTPEYERLERMLFYHKVGGHNEYPIRLQTMAEESTVWEINNDQ